MKPAPAPVTLARGSPTQVADSMSRFALPRLDADGSAVVMWHTALNHGHGSTQWVARLP